MGKKKDRQFWESAGLNNATYIQYYNRLTELAISMFEWKNLPDTVDERFLELTLFGDGMAVFFKDEELGFLGTRVMIAGEWDIYQIPTLRTAYASNGYQNMLNEDNSVLIFNNMLRKNSRLDVDMFAKRLYNLDRVIDINANAQKTPILIVCDENQQLTMKNLYMQYDGNEPVIWGQKNLDLNGIKVLTTGAPFICDKIYTLKTEIWNEALTYLGISNINVQKKERLISDEVMRNSGGVIASRYSRLNMRRQAAEEINRMFGLNIEVNFRQDYRETDSEKITSGDSSDNSVDNIARNLDAETE